jgi:uncharacterized membrane protein YgaE (UPF0421/DUF939 family)
MAEPRFVTTPQGTVEVIMDEKTYEALVSSNSPDPLLLRDLTLEQLKALAEGKLTTDIQAQLNGLIQKEKAGQATTEESAILDKLLQQLDQLNLLKARALYTLKKIYRIDSVSEQTSKEAKLSEPVKLEGALTTSDYVEAARD